MKKLVLAEKPSVGRELARVLKCNQKGNGYIMGKDYIVTWALGHLVTLAPPEDYDAKYKAWRAEDLPMLPEKIKLVVIKETAKQFTVVRNLLKREDVGELILATDAGREGELVGRWIIEKAGFRKPIKRLWISSQTDKAILDGFRNLKPGKDYENLYYAALSRAEADWLVGLNVTRALTCKYNGRLSAGRVQTPTLYLIVERENEIKNFVPKDYWTIKAEADKFSLSWRDKRSNQLRIFDKDKVEKTIQKVTNKNGTVTQVTKQAKHELAPLLYDLTELQRDANRKYGFSAKQTLSIMQRLYENYKLLTYPRTDSRYLTTDIVATLPERLKSISVGLYREFAQTILKGKITPTKRFVDNSKVTDHHAIIPTEQHVDLSVLGREEKCIYDLVVKRFLAVLSKPFDYELTTVEVDINGEAFYTKGKIVISKGWKQIYGSTDNGNSSDGFSEDDEDEDMGKEQLLPDLKKGQEIKIKSVKSQNSKTKPPARFTEATLLSAMEHPGKYTDDEALRETLESVSGLGTPATRADIIEKLFSSFYVERKGKEIHPTSTGMQLVNLVPQELKSPELTAKWEQELAKISKGTAKKDTFIAEMRNYATLLVKNVNSSEAKFKNENITREKCPQCGKFLLKVNGKKGTMLVCQDRECGFRKNVAQASNARCPECHKKMELRGDGDSKIFACSCGYREKLSAFTKRKEAESNQLNKRDVGRYLKNQNDDSGNTALADALMKWKQS